MTRHVARILVSGQRRRLEDEWNRVHAERPMTAGAVALDVGSPEYEQLKTLYHRLARDAPIEWHETIDVEYEPDELAAHAIVTLWISATAGPGNNTLHPAYANARRCPQCGVETYRYQRAPLHLDPARIDEVDIAETDHGEVVVSPRARDVFERNGVESVTYEPIVWAAPPPRPRTMHQLVVVPRLGPLAASFPLVKEHRCPVCGEYRTVGIAAATFGPARQLRFPRSSYHGEGLAITRERFGSGRKRHLIVASGRLYCALRDAGIIGFWAEPAHLLEDDVPARE